MSSTATDSISEYAGTFLASLPQIERIVEAQARRHALSAADADEFASWAKERLIDNDYAVFRKFGGRCRLSTYLTTVLVNLFHDFRNSRWGRWRPSASATRLGPIAVRLEELLYRDNMPLREACGVLCSADPTLVERDLIHLSARIPVRSRPSEMDLDVAVRSGMEPSTHPAGTLERDELLERAESVLGLLIDRLPGEDALILRMRFWHNLTLADIARTLHLEQKALYRRVESLKTLLRRELEAHGIDQPFAAELIGGVER